MTREDIEKAAWDFTGVQIRELEEWGSEDLYKLFRDFTIQQVNAVLEEAKQTAIHHRCFNYEADGDCDCSYLIFEDIEELKIK